jgi:hypothetical protein
MIRHSFLPPSPSLAGPDGELILLRITVDPRQLERLLEALAETSYHINPQMFPNSPQGSVVEFPAYEGWVEGIEARLRAVGLSGALMESTRMVTRLAS